MVTLYNKFNKLTTLVNMNFMDHISLPLHIACHAPELYFHLKPPDVSGAMLSDIFSSVPLRSVSSEESSFWNQGIYLEKRLTYESKNLHLIRFYEWIIQKLLPTSAISVLIIGHHAFINKKK